MYDVLVWMLHRLGHGCDELWWTDDNSLVLGNV